MNALATAPVSQEAELDRQLEELVGKIVRGEASEREFRQYREMSMMRLRLMKPNLLGRVERLRRASAG